MFKELTAATFALALTLPAAALASDSMDADADGMVTADEFAAAHPDAPSGTFEQIDVNADGALADDEIAAAREAGILPDAS
ncbi:hypothetical protein PEL8287_00850 [Roseovarius litorisediminis]|uniref:EF-hand domain-containing protein n=1 Tax=Roseovarius litorisediminis TaxID=1312363 RepID=A0A1Y5RLW6_9RHOB|nr:calcium-binding protein [Roseovarius litorisediminis]SLN20524.1 hypothetical protein PEL8287_00850 [Roseovarius litorisediminis]